MDLKILTRIALSSLLKEGEILDSGAKGLSMAAEFRAASSLNQLKQQYKAVLFRRTLCLLAFNGVSLC